MTLVATGLRVEQLPATLGGSVNRGVVAGDEVVKGRIKRYLCVFIEGDGSQKIGTIGRAAKDTLECLLVFLDTAICATAACRFGCPISLGLTIGNPACSSSVLARPSQNCVLLYRAFRMVGALRWPTRPFIPTDVGFLSVNASSGLWQVLHDTVSSADRRRSKKKFLAQGNFLRSLRIVSGDRRTSRLNGHANLLKRLRLC
jgi:hypothetical protein